MHVALLLDYMHRLNHSFCGVTGSAIKEISRKTPEAMLYPICSLFAFSLHVFGNCVVWKTLGIVSGATARVTTGTPKKMNVFPTRQALVSLGQSCHNATKKVNIFAA